MAEVLLPAGGHFGISWGIGTELRLSGTSSRPDPLRAQPSATASSVQWCEVLLMPTPCRSGRHFCTGYQQMPSIIRVSVGQHHGYFHRVGYRSTPEFLP